MYQPWTVLYIRLISFMNINAALKFLENFIYKYIKKTRARWCLFQECRLFTTILFIYLLLPFYPHLGTFFSLLFKGKEEEREGNINARAKH